MRDMIRPIPCILTFLSVAASIPLHAQPASQPEAGAVSNENDPVESLGRYLRILSTSPRDLEALTGAGRAALDVGDANAAIGFYARAEEIAPRDGRIKAGLASALVQMEQPKQALKLFGQAVEFGVPAASIAADRGLAYDLSGDNRRAQADYMLALKTTPTDETVRRLALSQAMSGDRAAALATLDPLLRHQDKAAWRASTFVLAITGDQKTAAERLAQLVTPQQANALSPFLGELAGLKPAQQARAVHFGHLPADKRAGSTALASASPAPSGPVAAVPPAISPAMRGNETPGTQATAPTTGTALALVEPRRVAPSALGGMVPPLAAGTPALAAASDPNASSAGATPPRAVAASPAGGTSSGVGAADPRFVDAAPLQPVARAEPKPAPSTANFPPVQRSDLPQAGIAPSAPARSIRQAVNITDPVDTVRATPSGAKAALATADAGEKARKAPDRGANPTKSGKADPTQSAQLTERTSKGRRGADESKAVGGAKDTQNADAIKDKKKQSADAAKAEKAKRVADTAKAEKTKQALAAKKEPQRYWVQVAGGANKADLGKAWTKVKAQYPQLMAGRSPWTTPLRFTNRLLVGPFKSDDEAQAFVNTTGKAGFTTFPFTSSAGQPVERVPAK